MWKPIRRPIAVPERPVEQSRRCIMFALVAATRRRRRPTAPRRPRVADAVARAARGTASPSLAADRAAGARRRASIRPLAAQIAGQRRRARRARARADERSALRVHHRDQFCRRAARAARRGGRRRIRRPRSASSSASAAADDADLDADPRAARRPGARLLRRHRRSDIVERGGVRTARQDRRAHEYTHALQDQHFDLDAEPTRTSPRAIAHSRERR